jgi:hypothetical protein
VNAKAQAYVRTKDNFEVALMATVVAGLILAGTGPAFSRDKYETIEAQARGTGTQMGANIGVNLNIYEFSGSER